MPPLSIKPLSLISPSPVSRDFEGALFSCNLPPPRQIYEIPEVASDFPYISLDKHALFDSVWDGECDNFMYLTI